MDKAWVHAGERESKFFRLLEKGCSRDGAGSGFALIKTQ